MDDFTSKPGVPNMFGLVQGETNDIQPGKRPLSSMTPTIVLRDGKLAMVTGSPGGSRIITIVLETLLNVFDFGMNAQAAVDAPRIHMQWLPDEIQYEPGALTDAVMRRFAPTAMRSKRFRSGDRCKRSSSIRTTERSRWDGSPSSVRRGAWLLELPLHISKRQGFAKDSLNRADQRDTAERL